MKKEALKPEELYVLLDREFRRRRPRECGTCYVQLPYRVDANRETDGNWEVLLPPGCGNGCGDAMDEIIAELRTRYELAG